MQQHRSDTKNYAVKVDIHFFPVTVVLGIVEHGHGSVAPGTVAKIFLVEEFLDSVFDPSDGTP